MTDIQKLRELHQMTCDERIHHIERKRLRWEIVAALPALLDELEKLRAKNKSLRCQFAAMVEKHSKQEAEIERLSRLTLGRDALAKRVKELEHRIHNVEPEDSE